MTESAETVPYLTNHSLRATTVTVLSASNIETRKIKAITGHKSDASIESYCERPTLNQFKQMSTALTSFIHSDRSPEPSCQSQNQSDHSVQSLKENQRPSATVSCPSVSNHQQLLPMEHESFFTSLGLNAGSILPSGSFNNCQFTFNVNMNNTR